MAPPSWLVSNFLVSDFTFTFHFHALEKEMPTHCSILVWRIPGMAEPGGLPFMGSHRVGHVCAQAWKPSSQHAGEKRGVAGLLLGRTERAARAAELQLCAQAR